MSFEEPRRLSMAAEGTWSVVEPMGRERMARGSFSYWEVSHASIEARFRSRRYDLLNVSVASL